MARQVAIAALGVLLAGLPAAVAACPPDGWTKASLLQSKTSGFAAMPEAQAGPLALDLVACLGAPDPEMRDGIAYEALTAWMRGGRLPVATLEALRASLYRMIGTADDGGFGPPFAALALAEVARTDRVAPWMTPEARADMVERAAGYLEGVDDYRGFEPGEGWRHGIAHGADWLMQLSLNPALDDAQRQRLVDAVAAQLMPAGHAYVFGEPERLAAPVLFAARAGLHDAAGWQTWLAALSARLGAPAQAWSDPGWLARRHNLRAFLMALHTSASLAHDDGAKTLLPGIAEALRAMR